MADIDQIIAGGAGASSRADFSKLSGLFDNYYKGRDEAAKNDLRDAFKGGVPLDASGQPDFGAMSKTFFEKGDPAQGIAAANLDLARQNLKFGQGQSASISSFEGGTPQPTIPPSTNRGASVPTAPVQPAPAPRAAVQPAGSPRGDQPGSIVGLVSAAGVPDELAGPVIAQISAMAKIDPNAALDPSLVPRIQQVAQAAAQRMRTGQAPQPTGLQPAPGVPPQAVPAPPQPQPIAQPVPQAQPAPVTDRVTTSAPPSVPSQVDKAIAFYSGIMSNPSSPKQNVELAKTRLEALQKNSELTPDQKNYSQSVLQGYKGTMQDFLTEQESSKAGAVERAKADVKEQQDYIDQGRNAQARLGTLNTISNIVSSDKNLQLGFGSETTLKIKMALQQAGIDFGDLSGAQLIQKLNGVLASESSKSFSTRPTQFEFKTFLANNPGLALDEKGNVRMLGILAQTAKREADLGKLARQNRDSWDKWDDVVEKYDADHPIKDPTTGKVLSNHSIIAPGAKSASAPGQAQFSSVADVKAAVASGKLKKGDQFLDNNGVARVVP